MFRVNMRKFDALPRFAAISALIVWGITFPLLVAFGRRLDEPPTLALALGIGLACLLILLALNPGFRASNLMLWLSGGIWTGAAYQNPQVLGFAYLLVAIVTLGGAVVREREHANFSLSGPVAFISSMAVTVVVTNALAG